MDPEIPEATETPATEAATEPKSFDERLMESIEGQLQQQEAEGAATDGTTDDAAATETDDTPAADATKETPAVETKTTTTAEPPFTEEQLDDEAFFDKLDTPGWEKLKAYNKALYNMGKQVARLRGKAGAALKNQPPSEQEARSEAPPKVSDALKAAIRKSQSLDEDEAIEGQAEVVRLTLREERDSERRAQQEAAKESQAVYTEAYEMAVTAMPDLASISDADLDQAVDANPKLTRKLKAAASHPDRDERVFIVSEVMEEAGRAVVAKRQAAQKADADTKAAAKKADDQARLRSNETNPSRHLVDTPSGQQPRTGKKSFEKDGLAHIQGLMSAKTGN